eukprot:1762674-Rhodomonas_salina.1
MRTTGSSWLGPGPGVPVSASGSHDGNCSGWQLPGLRVSSWAREAASHSVPVLRPGLRSLYCEIQRQHNLKKGATG